MEGFSKIKHLRLWLMLAGVIISLLVFEEVVDDVFADPLEGDFESTLFDEKISAWLRDYRSPRLNQVMTDLTALGSVSVISTFYFIFSSLLIVYRDFKGLAYLSLMLTGAALWPLILKLYYERPRPLDVNHLVTVTDLSFPSGHSLGATAMYIGLAYYAGRYARSWSQEAFFYSLGALLILVVGVTRIYLGVHYPTDVIAGVAAGLAWGFAVSAGFETMKILQRRIL